MHKYCLKDVNNNEDTDKDEDKKADKDGDTDILFHTYSDPLQLGGVPPPSPLRAEGVSCRTQHMLFLGSRLDGGLHLRHVIDLRPQSADTVSGTVVATPFWDQKHDKRRYQIEHDRHHNCRFHFRCHGWDRVMGCVMGSCVLVFVESESCGWVVDGVDRWGCVGVETDK